MIRPRRRCNLDKQEERGLLFGSFTISVRVPEGELASKYSPEFVSLHSTDRFSACDLVIYVFGLIQGDSGSWPDFVYRDWMGSKADQLSRSGSEPDTFSIFLYMSPSGRKRCPISIQLYFISIWL
jgi:hypothetical protein